MTAATPSTAGATNAGGAPADETPTIHILWINAGTSCDGDSVALTAAMQPSIEQIALSDLPGSAQDRRPLALDPLRMRSGRRRGHVHRVVLQGRAGRDRSVRAGRRRGPSPTSRSSPRATGAASATIPRPASRSRPVSGSTGSRPRRSPSSPSAPVPRTAASTPWRATRPARWACPTTGPGLEVARRHPHRVRRRPIQPDNFAETLTYLLYQAAGSAPMIPLDDKLRPSWLFGATVHEGCYCAGYYEQGEFATTYDSPKCLVSWACSGPVSSSATCPSEAG